MSQLCSLRVVFFSLSQTRNITKQRPKEFPLYSPAIDDEPRLFLGHKTSRRACRDVIGAILGRLGLAGGKRGRPGIIFPVSFPVRLRRDRQRMVTSYSKMAAKIDGGWKSFTWSFGRRRWEKAAILHETLNYKFLFSFWSLYSMLCVVSESESNISIRISL